MPGLVPGIAVSADEGAYHWHQPWGILDLRRKHRSRRPDCSNSSPDFRISEWVKPGASQRHTHNKLVIEGIRKAGIPE
jgi:hypothetical protein